MTKNDKLAGDIAKKVNKGKRDVKAGVIPEGSPQIAFITTHDDGDTPEEPERGADVPRAHVELGNYPNPFNPVTTITYELSAQATVSLTIYNVRGQKIRDLVRSEQRSGLNNIVWDGRDDQRRDVASGVYFARLQAGATVITRRMLLIR